MAPDLVAGAELGSYRIERMLGRGGMGVVYLAVDARLERPVALKVLAPELSSDAGFRERFARESRMAAAIDHPNIIPIYEAGDAGGVLYLAMRYVEGSDLRSLLLSNGPLEPARALNVIRQVGNALDAAHRRGIVHRDVKPGNIMLASGEGPEESGHAYLTDFGLTKRAGGQTHLTATGQFVGTVDYVAPEQIEGKAVDGRADIYSLGCVFFECLAGTKPFQRDSDVAILFAHISDPPPLLSKVRPDLPHGLDEVIATAMAKRKEDRYQTCAELVAAARAAFSGAEPAPAPPSPPPPSPREETQFAPPPRPLTPPAPPLREPEALPTKPPAEEPVSAASRAGEPTSAAPPAGPAAPVIPPMAPLPEPAAPPMRPFQPAPEPRRRHRGLWIGSAAALVVVGAVLAFLLTRGSGTAPPPRTDIGIFIMNQNGTGLTHVTTGDKAAGPAWSPDDTQLTFDSQVGSTRQIFIVNVNGSGLHPLTQGTTSSSGASFSPNGSLIVFTRVVAGKHQVFIMNAGGSNQHPISDGKGDDVFPQFKGNDTIIFASVRNGVSGHHLFTMSEKGTNVTAFDIPNLSPKFAEIQPTFSSDGSKLAFVAIEPNPRTHHSTKQIFVLDTTTNTLKPIGPTGAVSPAFSPNGSEIAFVALRAGIPHVFVANADGTGAPRPLTSGTLDDNDTAWAPNDKIAFDRGREIGI